MPGVRGAHTRASACLVVLATIVAAAVGPGAAARAGTTGAVSAADVRTSAASFRTVTVRHREAKIADGEPAEVRCPIGFQAIGGGGSIKNANAYQAKDSYPTIRRGKPVGWSFLPQESRSFKVYPPTETFPGHVLPLEPRGFARKPAFVRVHVICVGSPGVPGAGRPRSGGAGLQILTSRARDVKIDDGEPARVSCPPRFYAVGGGGAIENARQYHGRDSYPTIRDGKAVGWSFLPFEERAFKIEPGNERYPPTMLPLEFRGFRKMPARVRVFVTCIGSASEPRRDGNRLPQASHATRRPRGPTARASADYRVITMREREFKIDDGEPGRVTCPRGFDPVGGGGAILDDHYQLGNSHPTLRGRNSAGWSMLPHEARSFTIVPGDQTYPPRALPLEPLGFDRRPAHVVVHVLCIGERAPGGRPPAPFTPPPPPQPDLVVDGIVSPDDGSINLIVRNVGAAGAPATTVAISFGGASDRFYDIPALADGDAALVNAICDSSTTTSATVRADAGGVASESDEANNTRTATIDCNPPRADLVVDSIVSPRPGPSVDVTIRNGGDTTTPATALSVDFVGDGGTRSAAAEIPALTPGAAVTVRVGCPDHSSTSATAVADPGNTITETDEGNNGLWSGVDCRGP